MSRRAVVDPGQLDALAAGGPLPEAARHYLLDVLRLAPGTGIEVSDGAGRLLVGRLHGAAGDWRLTDVTWLAASAPAVPLVLLAALLKPKRWALLLEKAVELGATAIQPLLTHHVGFVPPPAQRTALLERWQRLALEASKQCRRAAVPEIGELVGLAPALAARSEPNRIVGDLAEAPAWPAALRPGAPTAVLVGPEGGLDDAESALAKAHGFLAVSLGAYPLRAETAATALLAMVRDRLELAAAEWAARPHPA